MQARRICEGGISVRRIWPLNLSSGLITGIAYPELEGTVRIVNSWLHTELPKG